MSTNPVSTTNQTVQALGLIGEHRTSPPLGTTTTETKEARLSASRMPSPARLLDGMTINGPASVLPKTKSSILVAKKLSYSDATTLTLTSFLPVPKRQKALEHCDVTGDEVVRLVSPDVESLGRNCDFNGLHVVCQYLDSLKAQRAHNPNISEAEAFLDFQPKPENEVASTNGSTCIGRGITIAELVKRKKLPFSAYVIPSQAPNRPLSHISAVVPCNDSVVLIESLYPSGARVIKIDPKGSKNVTIDGKLFSFALSSDGSSIAVREDLKTRTCLLQDVPNAVEAVSKEFMLQRRFYAVVGYDKHGQVTSTIKLDPDAETLTFQIGAGGTSRKLELPLSAIDLKNGKFITTDISKQDRDIFLSEKFFGYFKTSRKLLMQQICTIAAHTSTLKALYYETKLPVFAETPALLNQIRHVKGSNGRATYVPRDPRNRDRLFINILNLARDIENLGSNISHGKIPDKTVLLIGKDTSLIEFYGEQLKALVRLVPVPSREWLVICDAAAALDNIQCWYSSQNGDMDASLSRAIAEMSLDQEGYLKQMLDQLGVDDEFGVKKSLEQLHKLDPDREGRIYHHCHQIHLRNDNVRYPNPRFGKVTFQGDASGCRDTTPATLQKYRMEAVTLALAEMHPESVQEPTDREDCLRQILESLEANDEANVMQSLTDLHALDPDLEGRIYYHHNKIHLRQDNVKHPNPRFGKVTFQGDVSGCKDKAPAILKMHRIAAVSMALAEKNGTAILST